MFVKRHNIYRYIIVILLIFPSSVLFAQRKEISEARTNIKKGVNLEQAESTMRTLLKDSTNFRNKKIWLTLFDAVKKQYEQLNEKLYLKQQSDTAKFFSNTLHMFNVLESLDSVDALPDNKGVIEPKYRKSHASFLDRYRANLFNGGVYYVNKQKYDEAYKFFDAYIACAQQPLFTEYFYETKDSRIPEAAYWAVFCGYKMGNTNIIDKYTSLALRDKSREVYMLQYIAESYLQKSDTANYTKTLETAFDKYPEHAYFFPHLAIVYINNGKYNEILDFSDKVLRLDPNNTSAFVVKSEAYLKLGMYDKCVAASDSVISLGVDVPAVYLNAGLAYYNQSLPITQKKILSKKDRSDRVDLYKRALPYFEKYRTLAPDDKAKWGKPLYDIYLNLNMGDEFEEIEQALQK